MGIVQTAQGVLNIRGFRGPRSRAEDERRTDADGGRGAGALGFVAEADWEEVLVKGSSG